MLVEHLFSLRSARDATKAGTFPVWLYLTVLLTCHQIAVHAQNTAATPDTTQCEQRDLADALRLSGRTLILCGAPAQPAALLRRAEFEQHLGAGNICASVEDALRRAREILAETRDPAPVTVGAD